MPTEILMPALSPTMEEGTLAKWLVKEGDTVSSGDIIAEIETDKATMEFEAVDEGVVGKILVPEGTEGVKVNTAIAILVEEGEAVPDAAPAVSSPADAPVAQSAAPAEPARTETEPDSSPDWPEGTAMKQQTVREALRDAMAAMEAGDSDILAVVDDNGSFVGIVAESEIVKLGEILSETGGPEK